MIGESNTFNGGDNIFFKHCDSPSSSGPFYIKIYVHVITDGDGNGGQPESVVLDAVDRLREDYALHNIHFVWDCQINYVEGDAAWNNPAGHPANTFQLANNEDGVDIFINRDDSPDGTPSGGGGTNG